MMSGRRATNRRDRFREYRGNAGRIEAQPEPKPGKASRFIRWLKPYHAKHPLLAVVLYVRVSSGPQERRGNLDTNEQALRRACEVLGIPIVSVFRETCSGQNLDDSRKALREAIESARQHEADTGVHTAVLAPCTDRFVRAEDYNCKTNPDAVPTDAEYRKLRDLAGGVRLLTYLDPDMPLREVTSERTKWGQESKGNKGGGDQKPGQRKRRKVKGVPEACRLLKEGLSYKKIAERLDVSHTTIMNWVKDRV